MANALITDRAIVAEMIRSIHNRSALLKRVNRDYQDQFANRGAKVGSTINIRKPAQFTVRSGPVANIQDVTETTVPMTIQPEIGIDFAFSDYDLALTIDKFSERYIQPAAKKLASAIDVKIVTAMMAATGQSVGTPGTPPASTQAAQKLVLDAGVVLTNQGADMMDRMMVTTPAAEANLLQYLNLGFNSQRRIGEQYEQGSLDVGAQVLGFEWASSPNMGVQTVGPLGGTPIVNGANQGLTNSGATDNPAGSTTSLVTSGWTAAAAARVVAGDTFTIAGVFAVNPETKATTGTLQQFVVTANASSDGAGNATLVISPAIVAGGAFQNVTARPANSAALTFVGTANTGYSQSVAFVKDAFTFATVDLELPNGMDMAARANADGLSMRFVRGFDITNNRRISRFDILAGWAAVRPEWAVRVYA